MWVIHLAISVTSVLVIWGFFGHISVYMSFMFVPVNIPCAKSPEGFLHHEVWVDIFHLPLPGYTTEEFGGQGVT